jgi:two-component system, NarL family, sensor histidine kinase UhpB
MREAALAGTAPRPTSAGLGSLVAALWHRRSVRAQLLIIVILIDFVAALVAGGVTVLKARTSTQVEIAASMELAELLAREAVGLMQQEQPAERYLADLASQLRLVRHVRIAVKDAAGEQLALGVAAREGLRRDDREPAPAWFAALIAPPPLNRVVPVVVNGARIGSIEIVSEPRDEIAEVWENTVALALVSLLVNLLFIALLYLVFGRVLDPLTALAGGLAGLEQRNYSLRLPRPGQRELAGIADRFNALAQALEEVRAENERLTHRLITAQDDERRRTAQELHDEVGPCLFGLKANAASIATAVRDLPAEPMRAVEARVRDLNGIIEHLQAINRGILNRLRPMALGHVPLAEMLAALVRERERQAPQIGFSFSARGLAQSYGDSVDLTVYRCVQESTTNAVRHARAKHVTVAIEAVTETAAMRLDLAIRDDGVGIDPAAPAGFGLRGMQERVQALGGRCVVEGGQGTCVRITIPVGDANEAGA